MSDIYWFFIGLLTTPLIHFLTVKLTEFATAKNRRIVWEDEL